MRKEYSVFCLIAVLSLSLMIKSEESLTVSSFNLMGRAIVFVQSNSQSLRRMHNSAELPSKYQDIAANLYHNNPEIARKAVKEIEEIVINSEKEENIRRILTLKIVDVFQNSDQGLYPLYAAATSALKKIIPLLKDESQEIIVTKIIQLLSGGGSVNVDINEWSGSWVEQILVSKIAAGALVEVIPLLENESLKGKLVLRVAEKLSDYVTRAEVIQVIKRAIPSLEDESLRGELALKIAETEQISNPTAPLRSETILALSNIVSSLTDKYLKELALMAAERVAHSDDIYFYGHTCHAGIELLGRIIPSLEDESLRELSSKIVEELSNPVEGARVRALNVVGTIISSLEDGSLKEELVLKVAERLSDSNENVRTEAIRVIGESVVYLENEALKEDLALKLVERLTDSNEGEYAEAVSGLIRIIPSLTNGSLRKELTLKIAGKLEYINKYAISTLGKVILALEDGSLKEELVMAGADMLDERMCSQPNMPIYEVGRFLVKIIPALNERILSKLALKIAEKLTDSHWIVKREALNVLAKVTSSLESESLKQELASQIAEKLNDPNEPVWCKTVSTIAEIIPFLNEESSKKDLAQKVVEKVINTHYGNTAVLSGLLSVFPKIISSLNVDSQKSVFLSLLDKLSASDYHERKNAVVVVGQTIFCIKDEALKEDLACKVTDMLSDSDWSVGLESVYTLREIIPALNERILNKVALKVIEKLAVSSLIFRREALDVFAEIASSLENESLKQELTSRIAEKLNDPD